MAAREKLKEISVLKIDAEGAENLVITGALGSIRAWRPTILFESCFRVSDTKDRDILVAEGYKLYRLKGGSWVTDIEGHHGNLLAVSREDHARRLQIA